MTRQNKSMSVIRREAGQGKSMSVIRRQALTELTSIFGENLPGVRRFGFTRNASGKKMFRVIVDAGVDSSKILAIPDHFENWLVDVVQSEGTVSLQSKANRHFKKK